MSEEKKFVPYVPAETSMPELTVKALLLGVVMAIVLGAANAYLGMKVGLTVAATFPAAVVAMAALRSFRGNIREENLARTTASVGSRNTPMSRALPSNQGARAWYLLLLRR